MAPSAFGSLAARTGSRTPILPQHGHVDRALEVDGLAAAADLVSLLDDGDVEAEAVQPEGECGPPDAGAGDQDSRILHARCSSSGAVRARSHREGGAASAGDGDRRKRTGQGDGSAATIPENWRSRSSNAASASRCMADATSSDTSPDEHARADAIGDRLHHPDERGGMGSGDQRAERRVGLEDRGRDGRDLIRTELEREPAQHRTLDAEGGELAASDAQIGDPVPCDVLLHEHAQRGAVFSADAPRDHGSAVPLSDLVGPVEHEVRLGREVVVDGLLGDVRRPRDLGHRSPS